jgi:excisionase family DNA binding protein
MSSDSQAREAHRRALLRLRVLLLGESETPGLVRGEDARLRVNAELRHLRDSFDAALLELDTDRAEKLEHSAASLEADLLRGARASLTERRQSGPPPDLTPAECAEALGVSLSTVYRAISSGKIRATRETGTRRRVLRIPASEIERLTHPV